MRLTLILALILVAGCRAPYAVPPALHAPAPPPVSLYDGVGHLAVTGSASTTHLGGHVSVSPAPHLGVHVRGSTARPRFESEQTSLRTVEQSELGAGVTLFGPTDGALRAELTVDVAAGRVTGFGADSVGARCVLCRPEPISDLYRVDATRTRQSGALTIAGDWDAGGLGVTLGLSRVAVSGVEREGGVRLSRAAGTVFDHAVFIHSRAGVTTARLWLGGSVALGEDGKPDEDGVVRGLGGTYRTSAVPYVGLDVGEDLGRFLRPAADE
jgi:hypothetical protein